MLKLFLYILLEASIYFCPTNLIGKGQGRGKVVGGESPEPKLCYWNWWQICHCLQQNLMSAFYVTSAHPGDHTSFFRAFLENILFFFCFYNSYGHQGWLDVQGTVREAINIPGRRLGFFHLVTFYVAIAMLITWSSQWVVLTEWYLNPCLHSVKCQPLFFSFTWLVGHRKSGAEFIAEFNKARRIELLFAL